MNDAPAPHRPMGYSDFTGIFSKSKQLPEITITSLKRFSWLKHLFWNTIPRMGNDKKLLPTDDFVTEHGNLSKTFQSPPLNGTLCLAQMIDWHGANSPNHVWATFMGQNGLRHVTWKRLQQAAHRQVLGIKIYLRCPLIKNSLYRVAKIILNELGSESCNRKTIAVLANRDQLTYIALLVLEIYITVDIHCMMA